MRKDSAREKCKSSANLTGKMVDAQNPWEKAILDAEQKALEAEAVARELRRAAQAFRDLRDAGDPWPGTSEVTEKAAKG